ncbi:uncharacterized protein B0T15DRAFT_522758 [Chaetomium strumarium]|uniref:Uncharacterized protein n=1 Tax=Chaetomium strumarium TaxID=1170767 RepID=A0AAJ0GX91_9PEZI|nr:hypothetical protein B0T15DRAFT_522758 [Chaetomium strumarium]
MLAATRARCCCAQARPNRPTMSDLLSFRVHAPASIQVANSVYFLVSRIIEHSSDDPRRVQIQPPNIAGLRCRTTLSLGFLARLGWSVVLLVLSLLSASQSPGPTQPPYHVGPVFVWRTTPRPSKSSSGYSGCWLRRIQIPNPAVNVTAAPDIIVA